MIGAAFLAGGLAAAAAGFALLRRHDRPAASLRVEASGKPVAPLAGPVESTSLLGVAAGYILLLGGLACAVVGGAAFYLR